MGKKWQLALIAVVGFVIAWGATRFYYRYQVAPFMTLAVEEVAPSQYPEDPAHRSVHYNKYTKRWLHLVQQDPTHFDFVLKSSEPHVASIAFRDIDVSLFVPVKPEWVRDDEDLGIVALTEREWNRQQVTFEPGSPHLEIWEGNGFETSRLVSAELARNCLNAGLWEILLFVEEDGHKALYYQGWFEFPLGHYARLFETLNERPYWKYWHRLEHWWDPHGMPVDMNKLRTVVATSAAKPKYNPQERIIFGGEQQRKQRITDAQNARSWEDLWSRDNGVRFATFLPPGRYKFSKLWENEFHRLAELKGATVRQVSCPASREPLHEIELVFQDSDTDEHSRLVVGGIDFEDLPHLSTEDYNKGLYMPLGIGVPPVSQSYDELKQNPPYRSTYYSLMLDAHDHWINHHKAAIDGIAMHLDLRNRSLVHLYLVSYERATLVGHYVVPIPSDFSQEPRAAGS